MHKNQTMEILFISLLYIVGLFGITLIYNPIYNLINIEGMQRELLTIYILSFVLMAFISIFSLVFKKENIYRLFWNIVPTYSAILFSIKLNIICNGFVIVMLVAVALWTVTSIINWLFQYQENDKDNLKYNSLKEKHPHTWWLIIFLLYILLPTGALLIGMLPSLLYIASFTTEVMPTLSTWLGLLFIVIGIIIKLLASCQKLKYNHQDKNEEFIQIGLWKKSRHPDYFGELLFWVGIFLMGSSFYGDNTWVTIFSPIIMFLYLVAFNLRLEEASLLKNNPSYKVYLEKTNQLFPF